MSLLTANCYLIRRRMLTIFGADVDFSENGAAIAFCHQQAFKLKEAMNIFTNQDQNEKIASINARQTIDFSANYDVVSAATGNNIGTWQRKGLSSIVRDTWVLTTAVGDSFVMEEDSMMMALIRRFLSNLIPQTYYLKKGETIIAEYKQNFNPFVYKLNVSIKDSALSPELRTLIAAGGMLLATIEGKQK